TAPYHQVLVKVLVAVAHATDIERHLRLQAIERGLDIVVDLDVHLPLDGEVGQTFAASSAAEAVLQPRLVLRHRAWHEPQRQPAVGDLGGEVYGGFVARTQIDRKVSVPVQDRMPRFTPPPWPPARNGAG